MLFLQQLPVWEVLVIYTLSDPWLIFVTITADFEKKNDRGLLH